MHIPVTGGDQRLRVSVARDVPRGLVVAAAHGELTWANAHAMHTDLLAVIAERPPAVVVDLTGLTVRSRALLSVFASAYRTACRHPPVVLVLVAVGELARALARSGQSRSQLVYASLPEAVEAVRAGTAIPRRIHRHLRPTRDAPGAARGVVDEVCLSRGLSVLAQHGRLIVSELVTNAVEHARTCLEVTADLREPYLRLAVRDYDPTPLPDRDPADLLRAWAGGGLGLWIVAATATSWGSRQAGPGKTVWAVLRIRPLRDGKGDPVTGPPRVGV